MPVSEPPHILVVDDEPEIRTLLARCFTREGYGVSEAKGGAELWARLGQGPVSLVTLDIKLGGEDGLELAREIRAKHNIPIIMITGQGDLIDRVVGLELGADDYIAKPFHLREVVARVRAVLRRYDAAPEPAREPAGGQPGRDQGARDQGTGDLGAPASERFEVVGLTLDVGRRELTGRDGTPIELTTAEFNLLELFLRRPSRVMSRDNIMDLLKGQDWSPLDRSIDNLISRLRRKIEPDPERPRLIKTVRGVGYVLAADVRRC